ncbi:IS3 family transposase [Embleya sp. NBC_00896]|uniref:IS3 family transposase n=1 Tax=Embleya sp. NBC_00896 TaxID=2975961 RepID=UPI00386343A9
MKLLVTKAFDLSDSTYGYRRVHARLLRRNTLVGPEPVRQIMREPGLMPCPPRPKRWSRTQAASGPVPDLVGRDLGKGVGPATPRTRPRVGAWCANTGGGSSTAGRGSSTAAAGCGSGRRGRRGRAEGSARPGASWAGRWPGSSCAPDGLPVVTVLLAVVVVRVAGAFAARDSAGPAVDRVVARDVHDVGAVDRVEPRCRDQRVQQLQPVPWKRVGAGPSGRPPAAAGRRSRSLLLTPDLVRRGG